MQREQAALAELMNNERPAWAITLFRDMEDYIACGEQSFAKGSIVTFENFDEIDDRFDRAATDCADDRDALTLLSTAQFLDDGSFEDADEASANIERTRAMAFAFAMVSKFGSTSRDGAAEKYAKARFPQLVAATRKSGPRRDTSANPVAPAPTVTPPEPVAEPVVSRSTNADRYAGWNPLKPGGCDGETIVENPADVMRSQLQGFPESLEGDQKLKLNIQQIPGGLLAVSVVQDGLLDDSISATWTHAELEPTDDGKWKVVMMGEKWRCRRSDSDEWGIASCP